MYLKNQKISFVNYSIIKKGQLNMDMISLNIENEEELHVTKQEILSFFKDLKTMPLVNKELVYKQILNNTFNLPDFNFETYFLDFCNYKDREDKELVINTSYQYRTKIIGIKKHIVHFDKMTVKTQDDLDDYICK